MKVVSGQPQFETLDRQPRSLPFATASSKFAAVLSAGLAAASLLMVTPAFGQTAANTTSSEKQNLTCVTEGQRLVCDVQQLGQTSKTMIFEQKPYVRKASETVELTPIKRTALFNPELDGMLASGLLWAFYLSLPIAVIVAIWRYDRRAREQMAKLLQQVATLERIWQHPSSPVESTGD